MPVYHASRGGQRNCSALAWVGEKALEAVRALGRIRRIFTYS